MILTPHEGMPSQPMSEKSERKKAGFFKVEESDDGELSFEQQDPANLETPEPPVRRNARVDMKAVSEQDAKDLEDARKKIENLD